MKKIIIAIIAFTGLVYGATKYESTGKVGDYEYSHFVVSPQGVCQYVYRIVTESGEVKLVLEMYLDESIEVYKNNGTYGKKVVLK